MHKATQKTYSNMIQRFRSLTPTAITRRPLLLFLLLLGEPAMAGQDISFASGQASVPLPASYAITKGEDGLTALFGGQQEHKLELTLAGKIPAAKGKTGGGASFVLQQAMKKGIKASQTKDRAVLMEPGGDMKINGRRYRVVHWQIGAGNCVFTMTVTAPLPLSAELDDFLGTPLNQIVNRIGCTPP